MSKVISANLLRDGLVVFLDASGGWAGTIDEAVTFPDTEAAEQALVGAKDDERRALVIEPFIVDRAETAPGRDSMTLRNSIRAYGPTINYKPAPSRDQA